MKKTLLIIVLILMFSKIFGQYGNDTLIFEQNVISFNFIYDYKILSMPEVKMIVKSDPIAFKEFKKGRTNYLICNSLSSLSGSIIGFQIAEIIYSQNVNLYALATAGGLFIIAMPFYFDSVKHFQNSVDIYNRSIKNSLYD